MSSAGVAFIKRHAPPWLLDFLRKLRAPPPPIWRGVYARLSDVPTVNPGFGASLIAEMAGATRQALERVRAGEPPGLHWHDAFARLAAGVAARSGRVRVLDFGGGPGSGYAQLLGTLPRETRIDYEVVDGEDMCAAGRALFAGDARIRFSNRLPASADVDIVYVNSVLQYIDDYAGMLRQLAALGAPHLFLARLSAGDVPTFASQQLNVPGQVLPYWFLNFGEVVRILSAAGYRLAADELIDDRVYDQRSLPPTHRVERFRNTLFERGSAGALP